MEPAFSGSVIALAVGRFVYYVRVVRPGPLDFLLEAKPCVLHKLGVAAVPKVAMPLDRASYRVADGLDDVLVQHFAIDRRELLMPVHNLRHSTSGRTHARALWNVSTFN